MDERIVRTKYETIQMGKMLAFTMVGQDLANGILEFSEFEATNFNIFRWGDVWLREQWQITQTSSGDELSKINPEDITQLTDITIYPISETGSRGEPFYTGNPRLFLFRKGNEIEEDLLFNDPITYDFGFGLISGVQQNLLNVSFEGQKIKPEYQDQIDKGTDPDELDSQIEDSIYIYDIYKARNWFDSLDSKYDYMIENKEGLDELFAGAEEARVERRASQTKNQAQTQSNYEPAEKFIPKKSKGKPIKSILIIAAISWVCICLAAAMFLSS